MLNTSGVLIGNTIKIRVGIELFLLKKTNILIVLLKYSGIFQSFDWVNRDRFVRGFILGRGGQPTLRS